MRLKWVAGGIALLMAVVIVAVYLIVSSYDFNKLKPRIVAAVKEATGRELRIGGDIDLSFGLSPVLVVEDVAFQNASWGSRPELAKVARLEVEVALLPLIGGTTKIKRFILIEPDLLIETDSGGVSNLDFSGRKHVTAPEADDVVAAGEHPLPALEFNTVAVQQGRVTFKDGRSGDTHVVKVERAAILGQERDGSLLMELNVDYNGTPVEVGGKLGPFAAMVDPEQSWPLDLTVKSDAVNVSLKGSVRDPFRQKGITVAFTVKADDVARLEKLTGTSVSLRGPLEVTGALSGSGGERYTVSDLTLLSGTSDIKGSVEVDMGRAKVRVKAALSSSKIDVRPLLVKEEGEEEGTPGERGKGKVFTDTPLPLDLLNAADASLDIEVAKLLLPNAALEDVNARFNLNDGHLTIEPLKASIGGGAMKGSLDVKRKGASATVAARASVKRLDMGAMLKELDVTDALAGEIDLDIDVKGRGGSVAEIMARLDGTVSIVMGEGKLSTRYLNIIGADIRASLFRLINPMVEKEDYTGIECFVSRFDIKEGIADSTALVLKSDRMSVVGDGAINLKTEKLNLSLKPVPHEGLGTTGSGKLSVSLSELAKPFKLGGTLSDPSLSLDPLQSVLTVGKVAGGVAAFGPAGIAAALASTDRGSENICLTAIETARTGVKTPAKKSVTEKTTDVIEESIKGVGKEFMDLLGQ